MRVFTLDQDVREGESEEPVEKSAAIVGVRVALKNPGLIAAQANHAPAVYTADQLLQHLMLSKSDVFECT